MAIRDVMKRYLFEAHQSGQNAGAGGQCGEPSGEYAERVVNTVVNDAMLAGLTDFHRMEVTATPEPNGERARLAATILAGNLYPMKRVMPKGVDGPAEVVRVALLYADELIKQAQA